GDVNIAALADRFSVVDGFEDGKTARMLLNLACDRVEKARSLMSCKSLPNRKRGASRFHRSVNVRSASLRDFSDSFSGGRIRGIEVFAFGRLLPFASDEMPKAAFVRVEPDESFFGVLGSGTVFHRFVFFEDAHIVISHAMGWRCSAE